MPLTKTSDSRPVGGGKACKASKDPRKTLGSGASSDGESLPSTPDEHDDAFLQVFPKKKQKICSEVQRPDLDVTVKEFVENKLIIRSSPRATHVLMMGSPTMMLEPLPCPFEDTGCASFRAYAPQMLKEHLESPKHKLHNVQLNFVCPCPAACNVVNGRPSECEAVVYDPYSGILADHLRAKHKEYDDKMETALCCRLDDDEEEEEYEDFDGVVVTKEDKKYIKHLNSRKKFPDWTKKLDQPLPSQLIAEKVTIRAFMQNEKIYYKCNVYPCGGKIFRYRDIGEHLHDGHPGVLGDQTEWYERCPACPTTMHWCEQKMVLHIRAMHPELLGKPVHFVQKALDELAKLQGQIQEVCVGEAIADTAEPGDESDGTKEHLLNEYVCPAEGCKKRFEVREFVKWHLIVHHEKQWNVGGNSEPISNF